MLTQWTFDPCIFQWYTEDSSQENSSPEDSSRKIRRRKIRRMEDSSQENSSQENSSQENSSHGRRDWNEKGMQGFDWNVGSFV